MAVPPLIPELPQAPSRSQGQASFNLYAEPFIAAMPPMVVNINTSLDWIGQQVTVVDGYRQAAATGAQNAATSAQSAQAQVGLAADQVSLARTARTDAQAARDSAQASALAAGAAAGLPPQRVPFSVLQINAGGNVAWGYGVPDTSAALVGQALVLGAGKVPGWGYAGAQIGDVLYTSRNPGAGYLPASGGIYLQSAYPAYFAQIGLIGGQRANSFTAKSLTPSLAQMAFGENGVVVGVSNSAGTSGNIYRSTDYGNTFSLLTPSFETAGVSQVLHLGGTNWLFGFGVSKIYLSADNGQTISSVNIAGAFSRAYTDKVGTIIVITSTVTLRSLNNGQSFSVLPFSSPTGFLYAGAGRWVGFANSNSGSCWVSDDAFSTGTARSFNGTLNGSPSYADADPNTGVIVIASSNGGSAIINLAISYDRGESFGATASGSSYPLRAVVNAGADTWLILGYQSSSAFDIRKSTNGAKTFTNGPTVGTAVSPIQLISDPLKGQVIANTATGAGAGSYAVSAPVLGYDGATQFKVPTLAKQEGVSPYVRAA